MTCAAQNSARLARAAPRKSLKSNRSSLDNCCPRKLLWTVWTIWTASEQELSSIMSIMSMLRRRRLTMLNPRLQPGVEETPKSGALERRYAKPRKRTGNVNLISVRLLKLILPHRLRQAQNFLAQRRRRQNLDLAPGPQHQLNRLVLRQVPDSHHQRTVRQLFDA